MQSLIEVFFIPGLKHKLGAKEKKGKCLLFFSLSSITIYSNIEKVHIRHLEVKTYVDVGYNGRGIQILRPEIYMARIHPPLNLQG